MTLMESLLYTHAHTHACRFTSTACAMEGLLSASADMRVAHAGLSTLCVQRERERERAVSCVRLPDLCSGNFVRTTNLHAPNCRTVELLGFPTVRENGTLTASAAACLVVKRPRSH